MDDFALTKKTLHREYLIKFCYVYHCILGTVADTDCDTPDGKQHDTLTGEKGALKAMLVHSVNIEATIQIIGTLGRCDSTQQYGRKVRGII